MSLINEIYYIVSIHYMYFHSHLQHFSWKSKLNIPFIRLTLYVWNFEVFLILTLKWTLWLNTELIHAIWIMSNIITNWSPFHSIWIVWTRWPRKCHNYTVTITHRKSPHRPGLFCQLHSWVFIVPVVIHDGG